jgi:antitoxin component of MazEF toxin-antitoxin module
MKDGSFLIPKNVAIQNTIQIGKQVDIVISSNNIIEISGPKNLSNILQKVDINEKVRQFKRMLIEDARKEFIKLNGV